MKIEGEMDMIREEKGTPFEEQLLSTEVLLCIGPLILVQMFHNDKLIE